MKIFNTAEEKERERKIERIVIVNTLTGKTLEEKEINLRRLEKASNCTS